MSEQEQGYGACPTGTGALVNRAQEVSALTERLRARDPFVNDPVSLKPRLRNPDGPDAVQAIATLEAMLQAKEDGLRVRDDRITTLEARIAQLEGVEEQLDIAQGLVECACGHDNASDVCMGHQRILTARDREQITIIESLRAKVAQLEADRAQWVELPRLTMGKQEKGND